MLEKYHFWCAYGPEDHSSNLPTAEKREQGERRRLTEHGESIKRGCQAHFSVTVRAQNSRTKLSCASIRETISKQEQPCHGAECASAGRHHTQPHLAKACKAAVEAQLLAGINHSAILQQIGQNYTASTSCSTILNPCRQPNGQWTYTCAIASRHACIGLPQLE